MGEGRVGCGRKEARARLAPGKNSRDANVSEGEATRARANRSRPSR